MASIYLAGKIAKNDWRHIVVDGLRGAFDYDSDRSWPTLRGAVLGLDYVGPYFICDDHGCAHGDTSHGVASGGRYCGDAYEAPTRDWTLRLCAQGITACDIFFAWVDGPDGCTAYGTLVELGMATALGKKVVLATPVSLANTDLWFAWQLASLPMVAPSPQDALRLAIAELIDPNESLLESPLEELFYKAHKAAKLPTLVGLVAQHRVTAEGRNYRLDFALPDIKVAFEMDGRTFHDTDKAFNTDRRRDLALELAGWRVHRFDGDMIRADPALVVQTAGRFAGLALE